MNEDGPNLPITVVKRDWKSLAATVPIPIAIFTFAVGVAAFGWRFFPIAIAVIALMSALLRALQHVQRHRVVTPRLSYTLNASIGRRAGRLLVDDRGMQWWPYSDRHGEPELVTTWTAVESVEIEPVAAAMPRCRLHPSSPEPFDVRFESGMGARRLSTMLKEVIDDSSDA